MADTDLAVRGDAAEDLVEQLVAGVRAICVAPGCSNVFVPRRGKGASPYCGLDSCERNFRECAWPGCGSRIMRGGSNRGHYCQKPSCVQDRADARKPIACRSRELRQAVRDAIEEARNPGEIAPLMRQLVKHDHSGPAVRRHAAVQLAGALLAHAAAILPD